MNNSRYGSKPKIALWMLVAVADVALLAAAAGPLLIMLLIAGLVIVGGTVAGMRMAGRRQPGTAKVASTRRGRA
jgi:hypothetical protein